MNANEAQEVRPIAKAAPNTVTMSALVRRINRVLAHGGGKLVVVKIPADYRKAGRNVYIQLAQTYLGRGYEHDYLVPIEVAAVVDPVVLADSLDKLKDGEVVIMPAVPKKKQYVYESRKLA